MFIRIERLWVPALVFALGLAAQAREPLPFQDRVKAQGAIERVLYSHRTLPGDPAFTPPPFEQALSPESLEAKVRDYLSKEAALEQLWRRPVTEGEVQAELERIARNTKDAQTLGELFTALGDDPALVAECLVRPLLVDRRIRQLYAGEARFHETARRLSLAARQDALGGTLRSTSPSNPVRRLRLTVAEEGTPPRDESGAEGWYTLSLSTEEFERLSALYPPAGELGWREEDEAFVVSRTERRESVLLEVEVQAFPKRPFDAWWSEQRPLYGRTTLSDRGTLRYTLPAIGPAPAATCSAQWLDTNLDNVMDPRSGHTAVWTGTEMILWGGGAGRGLPSGGRYTPSTDSWVPTSMGTDCPSARQYHTAVWTGSRMIIWGGNDGAASPYLNTGGMYDPATDTWVATDTSGNVPKARQNHTAVWTGSEMIVWGGFGCTSTSGCTTTGRLNSGARFDPTAGTNGTWTAVTSTANAPVVREYHTAVWDSTHGVMVVWGGYGCTNAPTCSTFGYLNSGGRYSPSTDTWVATAASGAPAARQQHTALWTGTVMVVWGGQAAGGAVNTGGRYNPGTDTWAATSVGTNVPAARKLHSAVWTSTEMIVWGGNDGANSLDTGGRYNPTGDTWTATPLAGSCPSARDRHSAVWTGTEMIVWGGSYLSGALNTGARFDPTSATWQATASWASRPSPRSLHTTVWTGAEMIVWGGWDGVATFFQTGGRYTPATDTWVPTSTASPCPVGRRYHTAVWTGTRMIVWGGSYISGPSDVPLNTGGLYNPTTDAWSKTDDAVGPPAARHRHTAVWAPVSAPGTSVMIVWGGWGDDGSGGNAYLGSGAHYDPAADVWTPLSVTSAPSARYDHTAVWTGTYLVVWGGENGGGKLNTGGRYALASDTWLTMATTSLAARSRHTAVWSPELQAMIVWGGTGALNYNNGAKYFPGPMGCTAGNTWGNISTTAVPTARYDHSAVWTGQEMIVWGGFGTTPAYKGDGGRYNAFTNTWDTLSGWPSDLNAPVARSLHGAVWVLDKEMLLWGGAGPLASGGIFVPPPQIVGKFETCGYGPVTLTAASYPGYQWLKDGTAIPGATLQSYEVTETGVYNVTVTLPGGATCEGVDHRVDVWGYPAPTVLGASSGCARDGVTLSTQAYCQYQWNLDGSPIPSGGTAATYKALVTGDYSVTVTDSHGCQATSPARTITVFEDPAPTVAAGAVAGCAQTLTCEQAWVTYQWFIGTTPITDAIEQTYIATVNGIYKVVVTDTNGCWGESSTVAVKVQPAPTIAGATSACEGDAVTLTATPATGDVTPYQGYWWVRDGVDIPGANSATYDAFVSGVYTVRVMDADGCLGTSPTPKTVTINPLPQPVIQGDSNPSCFNVLSTTTTFAEYQWIRDGADIPALDGGTAATYTAWVSGDYQVRVTDTKGCVNTSGLFAVTIFPAPQVTVTGTSHGCASTGVELVAHGTDLVEWQWLLDGADITGATGSTYTATTSGFHGYSVRAREGVHSCSGTSAPFWVNLSPPQPTVATQYDSLFVTNGTVNAVLPSADTLYLGGAFTSVGPLTGSSVVLDTTTALVESGWPKITGTVYSALPDGSGGWYLGGSFTRVGGYARQNFAHLLSDQSVDPALAPGVSGVVYCMSLSTGTLYLGGDFTSVSGQTRNRLAALDLATGQVTSWNPSVTGGTPSVVYAVAVRGTTLFAGGSFTTVGGISRNRLAAISTATGVPTSLDPNASNTVYALAVSTDGAVLYAGGAFATICGSSRARLAAITVASNTVTAWNPTVNGTTGVRALTLVDDRYLYAGGDFTSVGGTARNRIAQWDMTLPPAANLVGWNPNLGGTGTLVHALAVATSPSTLVYAGGTCTTLGGSTVRNRLVAIDTNGSATAWDPNVLNKAVYTLALSATKLLAAGDFSSVNAAPRTGLAAFGLNDGAVTAWNPSAGGTTPVVQALALSPDLSTLYAGGSFTTLGGQTRNRIAAVATALPGTVTTWNPNATSGLVSSLALSADGATVYAGGTFTTIGGQARNRLAGLNASDGLATTWNPNIGSGTVAVRTLLRSGTVLYVGGDFVLAGGVSRNHLAAYDLTAAPPTLLTWNPNAGTAGGVYAMALSPVPDTLYVGGTFTSLGGATHRYLGCIKTSDGTAYAWDPAITTGQVNALSVSLDGATVYAGGTFTSIGGQARNRLAAVGAADAVATAWDPGATGATTPTVFALDLAAGGSVLAVGGSFTDVASSGHAYVAALPLPGTHCGVSVRLTTQPFLSYEWRLDGTAIPGATSQSFTASQPGEYTVRVVGADSCTGVSPGATFDASNPQPVITGPTSGCAGATTLSTDNFNTYQWRKNGADIPGATSRNYIVTDVGTDTYTVSVTDFSGCTAESAGHAVTITSCGMPEVSPQGTPFPARLVKSGSTYTLFFAKVSGATGYNVYEGSLGTFYSHGSVAFLCNATVTDLGTGEMSAAITPSSGERYYLVTAFDGTTEGASGYRSSGQQIDPAQSTCAP